MKQYPNCEAEVAWMMKNWQSNPRYAEMGVDGSERSIREFLSDGGLQGKPSCPKSSLDDDEN